jgi:hypothetical protein
VRYFRTAEGRWASVLALFALYMQVLIPLGQAVSVGEDENGFPIPLIICTPYGIEVLKAKPGEEAPDKQTSHTACPVCTVLSMGGVLPQNDAGALSDAPEYSIVSLPSPAEVNIASQFLPGSRTARAPPLFA